MKRNEFISAVRMRKNITQSTRRNLCVWANHARSFVIFDANEGDYTPSDLNYDSISRVGLASEKSKETFSKIYPRLDEIIKSNDILEVVLKDGFSFPVPANAVHLAPSQSEGVIKTAKLIALSVLEQKLKKTLLKIEQFNDVTEMKEAIKQFGLEALETTDYLAWNISNVPDSVDLLSHKKIDDPKAFLTQYKKIIENLSHGIDFI